MEPAQLPGCVLHSYHMSAPASAMLKAQYAAVLRFGLTFWTSCVCCRAVRSRAASGVSLLTSSMTAWRRARWVHAYRRTREGGGRRLSSTHCHDGAAQLRTDAVTGTSVWKTPRLELGSNIPYTAGVALLCLPSVSTGCVPGPSSR
jgi:hypothetical protein